jgi:hypothetical protein
VACGARAVVVTEVTVTRLYQPPGQVMTGATGEW